MLRLYQSTNNNQNTPINFFTFPANGIVQQINLNCINFYTLGGSDVRIAMYNSSGNFISSLNAFVYLTGSVTYRTGYDNNGIYLVNAAIANKTILKYTFVGPLTVTTGQQLGIYLSNNTSSNCNFNITGSVQYQ